MADALLDDALQAVEGAAADEQDVGGVDLQVFLVGMLAAALWGDVGDGALQDLEQRLLHPFSRDITRDRRVVRLARDLVDLVDVNDPALRAADVEVGGLDQAEKDVLDVLANVACFRQAGGVGDREGYVEYLPKRLRQVGLAAAGGADQHDVRLLQLDVADQLRRLDPLVVVVDGDREDAFGVVLADHVLIERGADSLRVGDEAGLRLRRVGGPAVFLDHFLAVVDALVADEDTRARDQLPNLVLALSAERAACVSGHDPGVRSWFPSIAQPRGVPTDRRWPASRAFHREGSSPQRVPCANINHVNDATTRPRPSEVEVLWCQPPPRDS